MSPEAADSRLQAAGSRLEGVRFIWNAVLLFFAADERNPSLLSLSPYNSTTAVVFVLRMERTVFFSVGLLSWPDTGICPHEKYFALKALVREPRTSTHCSRRELY